MTDHELLELAAKAAGIEIHESDDGTLQKRPIWAVTHLHKGEKLVEMQDYLMWAGKAAQAAGVPIVFHLDNWSRTYRTDRDGNDHLREWEPHKRPDEAFELAVVLGLSIEPYPLYEDQKHSVIIKRRQRGDMMREENPYQFAMPYNGNPMDATCRAIIVVAAEVGKRL